MKSAGGSIMPRFASFKPIFSRHLVRLPSRFTLLMLWAAAVIANLVIIMAAPADAQSRIRGGEPREACARYAYHRDIYLERAGQGASAALRNMAAQRGVPEEAATFYWAASLMRNSDRGSQDLLAQITLASAGWENGWERAEAAMVRQAEERGSVMARFLAGLMLSDDYGPKDPFRARAYLEEARAGGQSEAGSFLALYDACGTTRIAAN
jgi:hypothetical protein